MDLDEGKDKVYVNLNIQYNPKLGFTSNASANFNFIKPIIDRGGNYQVTVTDMQVDTKGIPLFMAEYYRRQKYQKVIPRETAYFHELDSFITLNYWVQFIDNGLRQEQVYLRKPTSAPQLSVDFVLKQYYVYDNEHVNAYIYSHQEFIDMVNIAIENAIPSKYRRQNACGYVIRNNRLVFVIQNMELYRRLAGFEYPRLQLFFSPSLYQYLGIGLPSIQNVLYWEYSYLPHLREKDITHYYSMMQQDAMLQCWNSCKAIVCYSHDLPIAEEIFPTANAYTELTHYEDTDTTIGTRYRTPNVTKKILYVHYIDYNKVRTLANGITVHNVCVDSGLKIDVEKTLPLQKFDINIGWMDTYGNLFPIKLTNGSCCNVRLCFTRKIVQDHFDYTRPKTIANNVIQQTNNNVTYNEDDDYTLDDENNDNVNTNEETKERLYHEITPVQMTADDIVPNVHENVEELPHIDPYANVVTPMIDMNEVLPIIDTTNVVTPPLIAADDNEEQQQSEIILPPLTPQEQTDDVVDEREQFYRDQAEALRQINEFNKNLFN